MTTPTAFSGAPHGAELYERFKVPRLFGPMAETFLLHVPLRDGDNVLDVACGTGAATRLIAHRVAPSGRVAGVDLDESMLAVARAMLAGSVPPIAWVQADATALPWDQGSFDVVLCQQGMQFFADVGEALREMHRVLAPGGLLAINLFSGASRYNDSLAESLQSHGHGEAAAAVRLPTRLGDGQELRSRILRTGFPTCEARQASLVRRVEPSQQWLLQDSAGTPFGQHFAAMDARARAAVVRELASRLKDLWDGDAIAVPIDLVILLARKRPANSLEEVCT